MHTHRATTNHPTTSRNPPNTTSNFLSADAWICGPFYRPRQPVAHHNRSRPLETPTVQHSKTRATNHPKRRRSTSQAMSQRFDTVGSPVSLSAVSGPLRGNYSTYCSQIPYIQLAPGASASAHLSSRLLQHLSRDLIHHSTQRLEHHDLSPAPSTLFGTTQFFSHTGSSLARPQ